MFEILSQRRPLLFYPLPYLMANRQTDSDGHCSRIGTADRPSIRVKMDPIMRAPRRSGKVAFPIAELIREREGESNSCRNRKMGEKCLIVFPRPV